MEGKSIDWIIAFVGGFILTLMIDANSLLAKHSTPLFASWIAYGVGAIAFAFVTIFSMTWYSSHKKPEIKTLKLPLWVYLGGIPGAMTIVLVAITVNSHLAFSGSFALMLVGQIVFGIVSDQLGLFGTPKKKINGLDILAVFLIFAGSGIIIFLR